MDNKKQTAEEYVKEQVAKNKEFYKTPEKMLEEMIGLLENVKSGKTGLNEDEKWRLITAVSEAWHVMLWVSKEKSAQRLVNTIFSFVDRNVAV